MRRSLLPLLITFLFAVGLLSCAEESFGDDDYVSLTVELTLLGSVRGPAGEPPPSEVERRREWHRNESDRLMAEYGISEAEYLEFATELHEDIGRYTDVLDEIAAELERRNEEIIDDEAPEYVKPPPGSFG